MPGALKNPDINGIMPSFCSIQFGLESVHLAALAEVNYDETLDIPVVRGTSRKPMGRPLGTISFEGSIVVYKSAFYALVLPKLIAVGLAQGHTGGGFSTASMPIVIGYSEETNPEETVVDTLVGVRIHSPKNAHSEGPDPLKMTLSMSIMDILHNGISSLGQLSAP